MPFDAIKPPTRPAYDAQMRPPTTTPPTRMRIDTRHYHARIQPPTRPHFRLCPKMTCYQCAPIRTKSNGFRAFNRSMATRPNDAPHTQELTLICAVVVLFIYAPTRTHNRGILAGNQNAPNDVRLRGDIFRAV